MTQPTGHPSTAVLMDHAAGTLSMAHHLVVATHALGCGECRDDIWLLDQLGGEALKDWAGLQPPEGLLDRCIGSLPLSEGMVAAGLGITAPQARLRTLVGNIVLPRSLTGLRPSRLHTLAPGIRHSTLWRDDRGTLHFIRVRPGVSLPAHDHRGLELTCVLSGAFHDDRGIYVLGDVAEEDGDAVSRRDQAHVVTAEPPNDCVCIIATTGRLRFDSWLARLLQPVMPF